MSNKKIFKELYSKKINKDNNYKMILESISDDNSRKKNMVEWVFIPLCLVIAICISIFLSNGSSTTFKSNKFNIDTYNDYSTSSDVIDESLMDVKIVDSLDKELLSQTEFSFLNKIEVPLNLDNHIFNAIYIKEELHSYDFLYQDSNNTRRVELKFSSKYIPLRDYVFNESMVSKIKDIEITIYKYENSYIAIFTYNNINFDIETVNITESEFIDILLSIVG